MNVMLAFRERILIGKVAGNVWSGHVAGLTVSVAILSLSLPS